MSVILAGLVGIAQCKKTELHFFAFVCMSWHSAGVAFFIVVATELMTGEVHEAEKAQTHSF
jgi:hypothetical protein